MMTAGPDAYAGPLHAVSERITVALILAAGDDLGRLQERTKLSKTDLANRAITSYEFFEARLRAGRDLVVPDNATGDPACPAPFSRCPGRTGGTRTEREPAMTGTSNNGKRRKGHDR